MNYEDYVAQRKAGKNNEQIIADEKRANEMRAAEERDRRLATPGGEGKYASFDQLPFQDQFALTAAIYGGSPSSNQYLSSAMKTYKMLEGEAKNIAAASNIKPDNPQYQQFIDAYLDGMYNDNFVSLDDVRSAMTNMSNANKDAHAASQANNDYANYQSQYGNGPVAGLGGGVAANVSNVDRVNAAAAAAAKEQSPDWDSQYGMYSMTPPTYDNPDQRPSWQRGY